MIKKTCKFCNNTFEFETGRQFGGHLTNCKMNPGKIKRDELSKQKKEYKLKCANCSSEYVVNITEHNFTKGNFKKNCSRKCSNKRTLTEEIKNKISNKLKSKSVVTKHTKVCLTCEKTYETKRNQQKYCSNECFLKTINLIEAGRAGGLKSAEKQSKRSKNESLFGEFCKNKFNNVIFNKPIFNGWDADIIILDLKIAILWNGKWHYEVINKHHSLKQVQNRDFIKFNEILNSGYTPYIIKDLGKYSRKKVLNEWNIFLSWLENFEKK